MNKCVKCGKETPDIYEAGDGFLCLDCAESDYNSFLTEYKQAVAKLHNKISKKGSELVELEQALCDHSEVVDTGYGYIKNDRGLVKPQILKTYRCTKCNKTIYR